MRYMFGNLLLTSHIVARIDALSSRRRTEFGVSLRKLIHLVIFIYKTIKICFNF